MKPAELAERHAQLDRAIERQESPAIALGLIRALNADNDCNYSFTPTQVERMQAQIDELKSQGLVFTEAVIDEIVGGAFLSDDYDKYEALGEILDEMFNGEDGNGEPIPQHPQPFHFDSYPFAHLPA